MITRTENRLSYMLEDVEVGYIDYRIDESTIDLQYIYMDPVYRGKGYTRDLTDSLYEIIKQENLNARIVCPVLGRMMKKHYQVTLI